MVVDFEVVVGPELFESVLGHAVQELDVVEILRETARCRGTGASQSDGRTGTDGESLEYSSSFHGYRKYFGLYVYNLIRLHCRSGRVFSWPKAPHVHQRPYRGDAQGLLSLIK